jgi:N-acetylneuraminate lyase
MITRLTGLIAAPFTPMHPDGSLNLALIERQAHSLAENDVSGAFICGTTGEGISMTSAERMQVAERWVAVAPERLKIIVHVAHNSLSESQALAAHATKIGVHAVATIGPLFFRSSNVEELAGFCARVAEAAPNLPFYYYHMPVMTGLYLPMPEFLKFAGKRIPNFAGIKFTDEDLMCYCQCLKFENGRFNILFGRDEILLAALALGATGAVGSTYNYMAPIYHKVIAAFKNGNLETARSHQLAAMRIIAVMSAHGGLPAGKAMMKLIGLDCGPVRPPLRNLSPEELETFRGRLEEVGFPALAKKAMLDTKPAALRIA